MLTKNDPMNRWQNGSLATIAALNDDSITVLINEKHYSIKKEVFEEKEAVFEDGQFKYVTTLKIIQFPLILSYAISIHKSQGATYDYVACDVSNCFADGQAYVALSRCRDLNSLWLISPITPESIKVNYYVKDFYLKAKKEALRQFDK